MNLTREQELFLIQLGIQHLNTLVTEKKSGPNKGKTPWNKGIHTGPRGPRGPYKRNGAHKWTPAQHRKFKTTMLAKFRHKKQVVKQLAGN
jgi:hypothetical protein